MILPPAGSGLQPTWETVTNPDGYKWQPYPRAAFTHTDSGQGEILTAGYDRVCDADPPCHRIITTTNPQTHQELEDQPEDVGYWHENNVVLQHTLKPDWEWDTVSPLEHYDLNRLFGTMGVAVESQASLGLPETRELVPAALPQPANWFEKDDADRGRIFSNCVLLPNGSLLVVGGQDKNLIGGDSGTVYWNTADRFDPQPPSDPGVWTTLAATNTDGGFSTPRGYHSVALLLPDGSVLLMGGREHSVSAQNYPNPEDTVDHFKPPYFFRGARPLLGAPPQTIRYGQTFVVSLTVAPGRHVDRFCLMGVGSVTHSYDPGQRYIELMWRNAPPSGSPLYQANNQREVLAPPVPDMAPEGFYMLFGVDNTGVPSLGRFVKLIF
jgi:hypothetical protein